ncbi:MAG: flagellar basal body rod protein FlgC [Planctomyces sp.]|nr:flagellar basal body rod protein FlgC [Planctomyces sp.]MBA4038769.1 flagellar basal body rod protein FlgC [Planctomyces sp.]MBA4120156.1 flagellar basal body rod protein FlgC [Isosphaera sp.]
MYGALDISTSGLIAQRTRLEVISANIANAETLLDGAGRLRPYQRRQAHFQVGNPGAASEGGRSFGVHVADIELDQREAPLGRYAPDHPLAYRSGPRAGYLATTNVNSTVEQINAVEAARAYEANIAAAEATKQIITASLRLIA